MRINSERGQGTVEWIALLALVAALIAFLATLAGLALPGFALAQAIASRLVCAVELNGGCGAGGSALVSAYGEELARTISAHAPELVYEPGMRAVPVDYRSCREDPCSLGPESGEVRRSFEGEPVTLFTHAVYCRGSAEPPPGGDYDCSGARAGSLYLQYWAYYPGSNTKVYGEDGFHHDDWESEQVRLGAESGEARASSHHGYNYDGGPMSWPSDTGLVSRSAWDRSTGKLFVSDGSHAGHVHESRHLSIRRVGHAGADLGVDAYSLASGRRPRAKLPHRLTVPPARTRWTPASRLKASPFIPRKNSIRGFVYDVKTGELREVG